MDDDVPLSLSLRSRLAGPRKADEPLLGMWLVSGSAVLARTLAHTHDFDFMVIDAEHCPLGPTEMDELVKAIAMGGAGRTAPIVRLPSHDIAWVKWALDAGASGLIVPKVETREQAEAIVDVARYPPEGSRSFGPFHAIAALPRQLGPAGGGGTRPGVASYFFKHSKEITLMAQIESKRGVENVRDILAVPGIDGAFVGPADLRLSLHLPPGLDGDEAEFEAALASVAAAARERNKFVGTLSAPAQAAIDVDAGVALTRKNAGRGMSLLAVMTDLAALNEYAYSTLSAAKGALSGAQILK